MLCLLDQFDSSGVRFAQARDRVVSFRVGFRRACDRGVTLALRLELVRLGSELRLAARNEIGRDLRLPIAEVGDERAQDERQRSERDDGGGHRYFAIAARTAASLLSRSLRNATVRSGLRGNVATSEYAMWQ